MGFEGELIFDRAGIIEKTDSCVIYTNIQGFNDLRQENLDLFEFRGSYTTRTVYDEYQVSGMSPAIGAFLGEKLKINASLCKSSQHI